MGEEGSPGRTSQGSLEGWLHQLGDWEGQIESRDIRLNPVANGEMV